jgi:hypothetical protein
MPKIDYTAQKATLLKILSKEDMAIIQKNYLDKKVRNAKIHEILQKGFSCKVLSDLTGISYCVLWNIGLSSPNANKLNRKGLIKMKEALDAFSKEISIILNDKSMD